MDFIGLVLVPLAAATTTSGPCLIQKLVARTTQLHQLVGRNFINFKKMKIILTEKLSILQYTSNCKEIIFIMPGALVYQQMISIL
jgi:hypothetical protein